MRYESIELNVPGQKNGPARCRLYLLDPISCAPKKKRPVVIVVPGGRYEWKSDREAEPIALRFMAMGCHAAVLDYSVSPNRFPVSLAELALAVAVIRSHSEEWKADPHAILACGFSAGGHLACSLGTFWNRPTVYEAIGRKPEEVKPDGLILCYPVITSGEYRHDGSFEALLGAKEEAGWEERAEAVSLERQVTEAMPPVFLWHTQTDGTVPVENSLLLAMALQKHHISCELHIYPKGGHGLALASMETAGNRQEDLEPCCQSWIPLVQAWLEERFIGKKV